MILHHEKVQYVGISAQHNKKKNRREWRHISRKYAKLRELRALLEKCCTSGLSPRDIQCVVGNSIWDCMVGLQPLYTIYDLIILGQDLIRPGDATEVVWHTEVSVGSEQLKELINAVDSILRTEEQPYVVEKAPAPPLSTKLVCTDASAKGGVL